jgi:hypothetical protein
MTPMQEYDEATRDFLRRLKGVKDANEKTAVIKAYVSITGEIADREVAKRAKSGQGEKCLCGVKLSTPSEKIAGVCIFCLPGSV